MSLCLYFKRLIPQNSKSDCFNNLILEENDLCYFMTGFITSKLIRSQRRVFLTSFQHFES